MEENRHFVLVIAGNNPEELIKPYSKSYGEPPFTIYKYEDRGKYRKDYIKVLKAALNNPDFSATVKDTIQERLDEVLEESDDEYYVDLTEEYELDDDFNAISDKNPNGKYDTCVKANLYAMPLITKDGKETYSDIKGNIDWDVLNNNQKEVYEVTWDLVMGDKTPETDMEKNIYENMKNRTRYFELFGNKENYVASNTAFWGYAFLSEKTGWVELEDNEEQFKWVVNFYNKFIKPQSDDTLISIYECRRDNN